MSRINISSGAKWEEIVGYSRAVRVGNSIHVAGTTAIDEQGEIIGKDNPYDQTIQILKNIEKAVKKAGAGLKDIVRTRIFVTDISQWQEIGRAHGEFFLKVKPAATMVEVSRLVDPDMLVEIEAEAVVDSI